MKILLMQRRLPSIEILVPTLFSQSNVGRQSDQLADPPSDWRSVGFQVSFDFFIGYGPSRMAHRSRKIHTHTGTMSSEGTTTSNPESYPRVDEKLIYAKRFG